MSKPLTFIKKVKLFILYLNNQEDGVIVNCAFCKSTNIKFENQLETIKENTIIYTSKYICNKCGSNCKNNQQWNK